MGGWATGVGLLTVQGGGFFPLLPYGNRPGVITLFNVRLGRNLAVLLFFFHHRSHLLGQPDSRKEARCNFNTMQTVFAGTRLLGRRDRTAKPFRKSMAAAIAAAIVLWIWRQDTQKTTNQIQQFYAQGWLLPLLLLPPVTLSLPVLHIIYYDLLRPRGARSFLSPLHGLPP